MVVGPLNQVAQRREAVQEKLSSPSYRFFLLSFPQAVSEPA